MRPRFRAFDASHVSCAVALLALCSCGEAGDASVGDAETGATLPTAGQDPAAGAATDADPKPTSVGSITPDPPSGAGTSAGASASTTGSGMPSQPNDSSPGVSTPNGEADALGGGSSEAGMAPELEGSSDPMGGAPVTETPNEQPSDDGSSTCVGGSCSPANEGTQPSSEEPIAEGPNPEQPNLEQPDPEQPDPEQPNPEQPNPEQPDPEQPDPEQPDPEQPAQGAQSESSAAYPCDGDSSGYDAVVTQSGSSWTAQNGGSSVYSGSDMLAAMQAAINSLSGGRTSKESVLVQGSGTISATSRLNMASHTLLNVCGTIDVTGNPSGDNAPVYGRGIRDVEIPNITISGTPGYGIFFRESRDITLGRVELRVTSGLGVRIDSGPNYTTRGSNLRIDYAYVEGASNHAVETYGIDGIRIGTVIARDVGYSGLLLNDSTDAEVGVVDGDNVAAGQGYAVFRMANRNGRVGNDYPTNIRVGRVIARGGGRGVFCVSESGGAVIDHVDLEGTGNNSILLENCYNVTVGNPDEQSRVVDSGELRVSARADEFDNSRDITFQNILVTGTPVRESPCADNSSWIDIDTSGAFDVCN